MPSGKGEDGVNWGSSLVLVSVIKESRRSLVDAMQNSMGKSLRMREEQRDVFARSINRCFGVFLSYRKSLSDIFYNRKNQVPSISGIIREGALAMTGLFFKLINRS